MFNFIVLLKKVNIVKKKIEWEIASTSQQYVVKKISSFSIFDRQDAYLLKTQNDLHNLQSCSWSNSSIPNDKL